jgi:anti-sigma regulatory factor (Ser/Thr protein kinase)
MIRLTKPANGFRTRPKVASMSSQPVPFRLVLPSDLKVLPLARHFVETVGRFFECDACAIESLQLALHEALQNIIRHAHCQRDAVLEIHVIPRCDGLELHLLDDGEPFDVDAVPFLDPGEMRIGGRGVYLMRRLVDELASEPRQPRGNILKLVKHFRQSEWRNPA